MWHGPDGYVNSIGFQGYFPWLDQSDPNPANHLFGVFAQDAEPAFHFSLQLGVGFGVPLSVIAAVAATAVLCRMRQRRLGSAKNANAGSVELQDAA